MKFLKKHHKFPKGDIVVTEESKKAARSGLMRALNRNIEMLGRPDEDKRGLFFREKGE